jgi:putative Ca2+/H+ antiporter (TMEM165/GDT1 family)
MNRIISGFFFILAMTLNFGFFYGDPTVIAQHSAWELFFAIIVNLVATTMKLGDKTQLGAVLLATSLVADLQLILSAVVWAVALYGIKDFNVTTSVTIVSLSGGALLANIVSVVLFIADAIKSKR